MPDDLSLSATEAGLLTIAERRGHVANARVIDRNDTTAVERRGMLDRLVLRRLLREDRSSEDELAYAITDHGRAALKAFDAMR